MDRSISKILGLLMALVLMGVLLVAAAPLTVDEKMRVSLREWSAAEAVASDTDGVLSAVTDDGTEQTITTNLTAPPCPRNVTVTAGGTAGDIKAISVTVNGKRRGVTVTESIGPFTVDTAGTVTGTKIFDTVDSVVIPAHDGNGATTEVGFGELLGLPYVPEYSAMIAAYEDGTEDASASLTVGATLADCYLDMDNNMDGDPISLIYVR